MRFTDKVVLIHGGNSGIGRTTAAHYLDEGARVVITGRDYEKVAETVRSLGPKVFGIQTDLADPASLDSAMSELSSKVGFIDVLFVNAGVGWFVSAEEITPEIWDTVHNTNLRGCFFAAQKALPLMRDGGAIVFNGSIGSVKGMAGNLTYSASKAGLRAVARGLAIELLGRGIRVNMVSPGPIDTSILVRAGLSEAAASDLRQIFVDNIPMKRLGSTDEVAKAVLFLSCSDSSYINGIEMYVDGGCIEL